MVEPPAMAFRSGDALFAFDADLTIVSWNRAAEKLTGVSGEEAVGRHCWEVLGGTPKTLRERPADRLREELGVMAALPVERPTPPGAGSRGSDRIRTCALTPTTTRWIRRWSAAASKSASTKSR